MATVHSQSLFLRTWAFFKRVLPSSSITTFWSTSKEYLRSGGWLRFKAYIRLNNMSAANAMLSRSCSTIWPSKTTPMSSGFLVASCLTIYMPTIVSSMDPWMRASSSARRVHRYKRNKVISKQERSRILKNTLEILY